MRSHTPAVRPVVDADFDAWLPLWQGYLVFYRERVPDRVTRATFERLCQRSDGLFGFVAVDPTDRPVGLAHAVLHPSTWTLAPYCYLEDLYVDPAHRGSGAARALVEAVYAEADAHGADRVYWTTQTFNGPARSLYDQVARLSSMVIYER